MNWTGYSVLRYGALTLRLKAVTYLIQRNSLGWLLVCIHDGAPGTLGVIQYLDVYKSQGCAAIAAEKHALVNHYI